MAKAAAPKPTTEDPSAAPAPDEVQALKDRVAELEAELAGKDKKRPVVVGGEIKGDGWLSRPDPKTGERTKNPGKDFLVWQAGSNEKITVRNVVDESEAIRLFKLANGFGSKITCRATAA